MKSEIRLLDNAARLRLGSKSPVCEHCTAEVPLESTGWTWCGTSRKAVRYDGAVLAVTAAWCPQSGEAWRAHKNPTNDELRKARAAEKNRIANETKPAPASPPSPRPSQVRDVAVSPDAADQRELAATLTADKSVEYPRHDSAVGMAEIRPGVWEPYPPMCRTCESKHWPTQNKLCKRYDPIRVAAPSPETSREPDALKKLTYAVGLHVASSDDAAKWWAGRTEFEAALDAQAAPPPLPSLTEPLKITFTRTTDPRSYDLLTDANGELYANFAWCNGKYYTLNHPECVRRLFAAVAAPPSPEATLKVEPKLNVGPLWLCYQALQEVEFVSDSAADEMQGIKHCPYCGQHPKHDVDCMVGNALQWTRDLKVNPSEGEISHTHKEGE